MTVLTICQNAALELGLLQPSSVFNTTDPNANQLARLANRVGSYLVKEWAWSELQTETTHTTLAAEDQGAIATIAPGFERFLTDTIYNRDEQWRVMGPRSPADWQAEKGLSTTSIRDTMRIRNGRLLMLPAPSAGQTIAFEYLDNRFAQSSGGTNQTSFQADSDVSRIDEELITLGIIYRFLERKGFSYAEAQRDFERELNKVKQADGGGGRVHRMDGYGRRQRRVPEGSWDIS